MDASNSFLSKSLISFVLSHAMARSIAKIEKITFIMVLF